jgi:hypothetical protein
MALGSWLARSFPYIARALDFLHLMEADLKHLSLTGIQMWGTAIFSIWTQWTSHDHVTMGMAAATSAVATVAHGYKRTQTMNAAAKDSPVQEDAPPWTGEADT